MIASEGAGVGRRDGPASGISAIPSEPAASLGAIPVVIPVDDTPGLMLGHGSLLPDGRLG